MTFIFYLVTSEWQECIWQSFKGEADRRISLLSTLQKWLLSSKQMPCFKATYDIFALSVNSFSSGVSNCWHLIPSYQLSQVFSYCYFPKALSELLNESLGWMDEVPSTISGFIMEPRWRGVEFWHVLGRCLFWLSDGCIPAWGSHKCHWCVMV